MNGWGNTHGFNFGIFKSGNSKEKILKKAQKNICSPQTVHLIRIYTYKYKYTSQCCYFSAWTQLLIVFSFHQIFDLMKFNWRVQERYQPKLYVFEFICVFGSQFINSLQASEWECQIPYSIFFIQWYGHKVSVVQCRSMSCCNNSFNLPSGCWRICVQKCAKQSSSPILHLCGVSALGSHKTKQINFNSC